MKRIIILLIFISVSMFGLAKQNRTDSLSVRLRSIEYQLQREQEEREQLKKQIEIYEKALNNVDAHINHSNAAVSNQISASSHTIQVWGWVISALAILASLLGIFFTRHINKMKKDISHLTSEAKRQLNQAKEASVDIDETQQRTMSQQNDIKQALKDVESQKQELQELYSDIQKNSQKIYTCMRREETKVLLTRLESVPEDVSTLQGLLLVRPLEDEDFSIMLKAYSKLKATTLDLYDVSTVETLRKISAQYVNKETTYILLFAQHFMDKAIVLPELRPLLCSMFTPFFQEYFFINDAEKSTKDFKKGVSSLDVQLQTELIRDYILSMSKSHYSKYSEWYRILLTDLSGNQLEKIWNGVAKENTTAIHFAKVVKEIIETSHLQSSLIERVTSYIKSIEINAVTK